MMKKINKKKIGIMSMQRIINYGSFLQAYGLYTTIKKLGYEVEFIDFHYYGSLVEEKNESIAKKIFRNLNVIKFLKKRKIIRSFIRQIVDNFSKLNISDKPNYSHNIDVLVIGSDEVFNCIQGYPVGYSLDLFGKGYEDKKVISYAASFGHTDINKLKLYNKENEISNCLKKFKAISVRDENSRDIVKELCNKNPVVNLDPVLISDFDINKTKEIAIQDYIIVYAYSGRLSKEEERYIKSFAKRHNKKIVSIGFYQRIADYNLSVSPFDVMSYFKKADYVITDTFHGTIFSIKSNTKFCTIIRDSNRNKLKSLLNKLNQEKRIVDNLNDIENLYNMEIDFTNTNQIIKEETKKTIDYLKNNL